MNNFDTTDEKLTSTLLEEVFNEIDSQSEVSKLNESCGKPEFLLEEYNTDLDAALGKRKSLENGKRISKKFSGLSNNEVKSAEENEISLVHEGDDFGLEEDDPFQEGEGVKWIRSTGLRSSSNKTLNCFSDGTPKNGKKWTEVKSIKEKLNTTINKISAGCDDSKDVLVDPVFHMRIVNPKVSTTVLKDRMIGREAVPPLTVKRFIERNDIQEVNWVTGGAIVGKFIKESQKGNQYCLWNLSDLKGDIKFISVLLFGSAYKEFWKLSLGSVVGILNPSVLDNRNDKTEATLRVDNSDRIMIFGTSKDYGTCKSKKNNGENCTAVVNKASCEYCVYHVKQVYDRASRRPDLQSAFASRSLTSLKNKVLGKNEVFYGGKSYTADRKKQGQSQAQREQERIRMSMNISSDSSKFKKDRELLQRLNGEIKTKRKTDVSGTSQNGMSASNPNPKNDSHLTVDSDKPKTEKMIDLDMPITYKQVQRAKANAIRFIRQNGPLKRPNDSVRKTRTPEQIQSVKRKLEAEERERKRMKMANDADKEPDAKTLLKQKLERSGITEKFLQLMNAKTENEELLKEGEIEEREKYFNKLEVREKMEEKMASTYKIDCKAVRCLKCNYKSFSASELCKKEKHPLKLVNAVKRFWKCGDCSARTVSLELVPLHSCKTCGSSKWEKTSMLPEKKCTVLPDETLSIRGHEEKFVGSVVRNPNINLLVPEEGS